MQMHRVMGIDIETYSPVDLAKAGVYAYAEAPAFDILLIGYKFDDETDVHVIDTLAADMASDEELRTFCAALTDPAVVKTAFNANFERVCLAKWTGVPMPPEQWQCTMVKALAMGLPGSLASVGASMGLPEEKLKDPQGKALIQYFCKPCKPSLANGRRTRNLPAHDPDKWRLFMEYNRQDVVTEQEILKRLDTYSMPESERRLWVLDQHINDNGVRLDMEMVEKIVSYDMQRRQELLDEARFITGLENPNSLPQLKKWLSSQGVKMESITKDTISAILQTDIPSKVRRMLEIRKALGKTSVAKYSTMMAAVCRDGRLRGVFRFYGASRTGRWASHLVQVHNLARNKLPDLELAREIAAAGDFSTLATLFGETAFTFSELVRTMFIPSEGCRFIVSDFAAIEARVLSWLSGEDWRLEAFREGKDIYCETASRMYHVTVEKHGKNAHLRQKGKVAELACGYQGGVGAMKRMDTEGAIPETELQGIVDQWREANPKIVKLWKTYERAAKAAIEEHRTVRLAHGIAFRYANRALFVSLPSGRSLCYWGTRLKQDSITGKISICYAGINQKTRQWEDTETYGGKLTENIVQAVARDCLSAAMERVSAIGYRIVMHVHDEMVVDVPAMDTDAPDRINAIMAETPDWAEGLPLKGDTYETPFYKKD